MTFRDDRIEDLRLGIIAANMHAQGLKFGPDFSTLDDMPGIDKGLTIDQNAVWDEYDSDSKPFPGHWDTDSRLCLQAAAPRPVTVLAAIIDTTTTERA